MSQRVVKWGMWLAALALIAVFVASDVYLWSATRGFPAMLDQSETALKFLAGRNFVEHGIAKQWFTPDFATGAAAAAHPVYYTHYTDFTDHFAYLLIRFGIATIPQQVLVGIAVTAIGLLVMFVMIEEHLSSAAAALCVLLVSVIDYPSVIVAGLNTHKDWAWFVVFAPLWGWKKYVDTRKHGFLWFGLAAFFMLSYYDYGLMVYVALVFFFLKCLGFYRGSSWRELTLFGVAGTVPALALHTILVIFAIGPAAFLTDTRLTYLNRVAGTVSRRALVEFYQSNGIVLWGYNDPATLATDLDVTLKRILQICGEPACWIIGITCAACCAIVLVAMSKRVAGLSKLASSEDLTAAKLVAGFVAPLLVMFPVFHIQMTVLYAQAWAPLYIFPFAIAVGLALYTAFRTVVTLLKSHSFLSAASAAAWAIAMPWFLVATQVAHVQTNFPVREFPGQDALTRYRGRSFVTNYSGAYVNYFTHEWAIYHGMAGVTPGHFPPVDDVSRSYVFERDITTNPTKYDHPEFAFLLWADNPALNRSFPLVDKGPNYWIYDLRDGAAR